MESPGALGEQYRKELHAGARCCAGLNSWKREPLINRVPQPKTSEQNPIPPIMQKFLAALGREHISGDVMYLVISCFCGTLIKDGMSKESAEDIGKRCMYYLKQHRSSFMQEFMG